MQSNIILLLELIEVRTLACDMPKRSSSGLHKNPANINVQSIDQLSPAIRPKPDKNPAAVALGRLGGLKGGKARAAAITAEKRKEIAILAAKARWSNKNVV